MQPKNVLALATLALADMLDLLEGYGEKTFSDVIAAFNRALDVDPNSIDVLNWRGIQMMRAGHFDKAIADYEKCIEIDLAAAPCRYNLMAGYAMNDQPDESVRVLFEALDYGAFSQNALVLLVLAEIERRDLFLFAAGWNPQLRGWHRFGELYDALQTPDRDHTKLRAQLVETFEQNGINSLASDMLLSALGDKDAGAVGTVWWFDTHTSFRQTPEFKQQSEISVCMIIGLQMDFPRSVGLWNPMTSYVHSAYQYPTSRPSPRYKAAAPIKGATWLRSSLIGIFSM